jgi:hypothetical protein
MYTQRFATAAAMFTLSLAAQGSPLPSEDFEECKRTENSARQVMKSRQEGAPMSALWQIAEDAGNEYISGLFKVLIKEAYQIPKYPTEAKQQEAIAQFQNNFFAACIVTAEKRSGAKS